MKKNNNRMLCEILLKEGKRVKKQVIGEVLIITVEAFGHTYRIESPYTRNCKIIQES